MNCIIHGVMLSLPMPLYWLCYLGQDYGMCCAAKKLTLSLSSLSLLFSVTTNAQTCVKVDDDNSPAAIVSGRITTHHKLPKGSEQRTGDGPWLILDQPLLADHTGIGSCYKWRKIVHPDRRAISNRLLSNQKL